MDPAKNDEYMMESHGWKMLAYVQAMEKEANAAVCKNTDNEMRSPNDLINQQARAKRVRPMLEI